TWRRSYPEDPAIPFLDDARGMLAWRVAHVPGKPVWITEFGWDASTKRPPPEGDAAKWVGVTDLQQAQYLVRAFLVFARLGIGRAYIYFFNDEDQPSVHAAAGLTRNFAPKPSYYAVGHLRRTLGDYRLDRVLREASGEVYAYRFTHAESPARAAVAVWSPTGSGRAGVFDLDLEGWTLAGVAKMATAAADAPAPRLTPAHGRVRVPFDESPVYLRLER
ncbi:MAG: hypothetical protein AAB368_13675, partial [bacterium]